MKRLLIVCGLLFSVMTFAQAQDGNGRQMPTPEERAQRGTEMLTKKLKLTDDQKTKVLAIMTDQSTQMMKLREDNRGDRDAMRAANQKLMAENDDKINALLTDDQKKDYVTYKEERKANMQNRRSGQGGQVPTGGSN
jgi:protein CpxP